ncbi:hypothetical protein FACS189465_0250 [Clostridia bacterium]|nr:hypothetical protein FACS189465_0250 [Clostridia bacterium]
MENNDNSNIEAALKKILVDEELTAQFKLAESLEEMYEFVTKIQGGYTIEEFEEYITRVVKYAQDCVANGTLREEDLCSISGGKINKIGALAIAGLLPISSIGNHFSAGATENYNDIPNKSKSSAVNVLEKEKITVNSSAKANGIKNNRKKGKISKLSAERKRIMGGSVLGGAGVLISAGVYFGTADKYINYPIINS